MSRSTGLINTVEFDLTYIFSAPGDTRRISLIVLLPQNIENKQNVIDIRYSQEPSRFLRRNGNRYAEFNISNPARQTKIVITVKAELFRYDLSTVRTQNEKIFVEKDQLEEYLIDEEKIEKNDSGIREAAHSIHGATEIETVKQIYDYVIENMEYSLHGRRELSAAQVLEYGKGDCTEYSNLFVALCRAKNIPARVITGYTEGNDTVSSKHNWAEVYLQDYGWVPFDPTSGDAGSTNYRDIVFSRLRPVYIYLSSVNNDSMLRDFHYASYSYWGDNVRLRDSVTFRRP